MNSVVVRYSGNRESCPSYESDLAAGADLRAALNQTLVINPGSRALIPTGLFIELPPGYEAQVRPRSGLAIKKGILVLNSPGTIDADYRGEIKIILCNLGEEPFVINDGDRIAQMVIAPVIQASYVYADALSESDRGSGGFGSTGH